MEVFQRGGERFGHARDYNQMDVIGHQAVAEQGEPVDAAIGAEQVQVDEPVVVGGEHVLPGVAALSHVISDAVPENASQSSHDEGESAEAARNFRKRANVPSVTWFVTWFDLPEMCLDAACW